MRARIPKIPLPAINLEVPLRYFATLPEPQRRLGTYVILAMLFHLLIFFAIQIEYPSAMIRPTPKARVLMVVPERIGLETMDRLRFWWGIHDPALLLMPQKALNASLVEEDQLKLRFSNEIMAPDFVAVAQGHQVEFISGELDSLTVRADDSLKPLPRMFEYPLKAPSAAQPTTQILYSDSLKDRLPEKLPQLGTRKAELLTESGSTVLSLGVFPDGLAKYVFIEESCGSPTADAEAMSLFRGLMFLPVDGEGVVWYRITVLWAVEPGGKKL